MSKDGKTTTQVWAYGRVSSLEQAENSHALEQQLERLQTAGVEQDHIFYDVESGANSDRIQLNKLLDLMHQGKVSEIIATRWDRLMRDSSLYLKFKECVQLYGVKIHLLDQGEVDFNTAAGELQADLHSLFAVYERNMLRERVSRGYEGHRKRLAASGRPPWGYVVVQEAYKLNRSPCICLIADRPLNYRELYHDADDSERLPSLSKADIARDVVEIFLRVRRKSQTLGQIREKYGIPKQNCFELVMDKNGQLKKKMKKKSIIFREDLEFWSAGKDLGRWLENPVAAGATIYAKTSRCGSRQRRKAPDTWEMHPNTHPEERLVTDEELAEITAALKTNSKNVGPLGATFYLTGLVICGFCQTKCVLKTGPTSKYYGCRHSTVGCHNRRCVRLDFIDQAIINKIFDYASLPSEAIERQQEALLRNATLAKLQQDLKELENLSGIGSNPILSQAQRDLEQEIEALVNFREPEITSDTTAIQIIRHSQTRNLNFWYTLTQLEREIIYPKLVEKIVLLPEGAPRVELKRFTKSSDNSRPTEVIDCAPPNS